MADIRQENLFLRRSLIANVAIDLSTHDKVGRLTTGGKAALCAADETPQFIFMASAASGAPVPVAFLGMGQVKLALSGSGSTGDKLSVGAGGTIVVSGTTQTAEPDADDIGIALADWTNGMETECLILRGAN